MGLSSFTKKMSLRVSDSHRTRAAELTLRESLYPLCLVTLLFFLWGFSYGLLDTLNKHFQNTLGITKARSSGLQAAYFGSVVMVPDLHWPADADPARIRLPLSVMPLGSCGIGDIVPFSYGDWASMVGSYSKRIALAADS